jgi:hypothetical protein
MQAIRKNYEYILLRDWNGFRAGFVLKTDDYGDWVGEKDNERLHKVCPVRLAGRAVLEIAMNMGAIKEADRAVRWKPLFHDSYFYLALDRDVKEAQWEESDVDLRRYEDGNVFKTTLLAARAGRRQSEVLITADHE